VEAGVHQVQNADNKRKAAPPANNGGDNSICRFKDCTRTAIRHKKERGGEARGSKMCFDHFLLGVEDPKLQKPVGVPIKGGKTMISKRDDDKKWQCKVFNVQMNNEVTRLRQDTFLKAIAKEDAEELLQQLHAEFKKGSSSTAIYNTNTNDEVGNEVKWDMFTEDSAGVFELPETEDVIQPFDIKRQKLGSHFHTNSLYQDEHVSHNKN
jgi:hypothetical protein